MRKMSSWRFLRIHEPPAKQSNKSPRFENLKKLTNFGDEYFELVFPYQVHLSLHDYPQLSRMNSPLYLYDSVSYFKSRL